MRPNLSFEQFAAVLGAIGATALVACGAAEPQPVHANEVAPSASAATGQASCSAAGCGASKGANAAAMPAASAVAPETTAAAATAPATDAPVAAAAASAAPTPASSATPPKPVAKKKKVMPSGEASCGAGTCSSNTKKIL